jgi:hypothetical protein
MMVIAVSTGTAFLSLIGLAVGAIVLVVVVALFNQVVRPALQIKAYSEHILDAGLGIARNIDAVDELERTRALATALPGLAVAYLEKLKGRLP